jgi:hypothetical protein
LHGGKGGGPKGERNARALLRQLKELIDAGG